MFRKISKEHWENIGEAERLKVLQELENYTASEYGRPSCTVRMEYLSDGDIGRYRNDSKEIIIDRNLVCYGSTRVEALDTVLHEGRHSYQHDVIEKTVPIDRAEVPDAVKWKENFGKNCYIRKDDRIPYRYAERGHRKYTFEDYRDQAVERDARQFARDKLGEYDRKYLNDPAINDHYAMADAQEQYMHATGAQSITGNPDHTAVIDRQIDNEYVRRNGRAPNENDFSIRSPEQKQSAERSVPEHTEPIHEETIDKPKHRMHR